MKRDYNVIEDIILKGKSAMNDGKYRVKCYLTEGSEYYGNFCEPKSEVGGSLHLAVSDNGGESFAPLNYGCGVLYAKADYGENPLTGVSRKFSEVGLCRKTDGSFGIIAKSCKLDGTKEVCEYYNSKDLLSFTECTEFIASDCGEQLCITKEEYERLVYKLGERDESVEGMKSDFIPDRADPQIIKYNGKYYFTATRDFGGQSTLRVRCADSLSALKTAEESVIYDDGNLKWAPEFHVANGKLLLFFASGSHWTKMQCTVMELTGSNPMNPSDWSEPMRIKKPDGEFLITNGISLDMTYFEYNGKCYLAWAQREMFNEEYDCHQSSDIYISEYKPESGIDSVATEPVVISKPLYGWERVRGDINEGAYVIKHNGKLFMTVAANGVGFTYCIKLMELKSDGNPLKPSDWITTGYPVLSTPMTPGEPGPGHSSFFAGDNDEWYFVYHWGMEGTRRVSTLKRIFFDNDGEPILNSRKKVM